MKYRIPVARPALVGNEKAYALNCLDSNWISSVGEYVERFEGAFADYCCSRYAVSCMNGTAALHLALMGLGVEPGDEIIVPTFTFVATANAVSYCGATPVFVDSEPETWNLDPARVEALITSRTKGIIAVHIYGHPVETDAINDIAARHGLFVIEDAAEALGASYRGKRVGSLGHIATFSFYGNKIITTGEGGMVVTDDARLAEKIRLLKGQGMDPARRYWFPVLGYNYRMTNIQAAIGLAQLEKADWHVSERRRVAAAYRKQLAQIEALRMQGDRPWTTPVYWMNSVVLSDDTKQSRDMVMAGLGERGIETRPLFIPMHRLPMYACARMDPSEFPVSESLMRSGFNVPTYAGLSKSDIDRICCELHNMIGERTRYSAHSHT